MSSEVEPLLGSGAAGRDVVGDLGRPDVRIKFPRSVSHSSAPPKARWEQIIENGNYTPSKEKEIPGVVWIPIPKQTRIEGASGN